MAIETIEVYADKRMCFVHTIATFLLTVGGFGYLNKTPLSMGMSLLMHVATVLFGSGFILYLFQIIRHSPAMTIDCGGVTLSHIPFTFLRVHWAELLNIDEFYAGRGYSVSLTIMSAAIKKERRPGKWIVGRANKRNESFMVIFPHPYPLRPKKFVAFLENCRQAAAQGQSIASAPWLPKVPEIVLKPAPPPPA